MKWATLYHKIGSQLVSYTKHNDVYAILENPLTGEYENVYLTEKYDNNGNIYLVKDKRK